MKEISKSFEFDIPLSLFLRVITCEKFLSDFHSLSNHYKLIVNSWKFDSCFNSNSISRNNIDDESFSKNQNKFNEFHSTVDENIQLSKQIPSRISSNFYRDITFHKGVSNLIPRALNVGIKSVRCSGKEKAILHFEKYCRDSQWEGNLVAFENSIVITVNGYEDMINISLKLEAESIFPSETEERQFTSKTRAKITFSSAFLKTIWGFTGIIDNIVFNQTEIAFSDWINLVNVAIIASKSQITYNNWESSNENCIIKCKPLSFFDPVLWIPIPVNKLYFELLEKYQDDISIVDPISIYKDSYIEDSNLFSKSSQSNLDQIIAIESGEEIFYDANSDLSSDSKTNEVVNPSLISIDISKQNTDIVYSTNINLDNSELLSTKKLQQSVNDISLKTEQLTIRIHNLQKLYSNVRIKKNVESFLEDIQKIWKECQDSYSKLQKEKKKHELMFELLSNRSIDQCISFSFGIIVGISISLISIYLLRPRFIIQYLNRIGLLTRQYLKLKKKS